jgi:hypothetical protein
VRAVQPHSRYLSSYELSKCPVSPPPLMPLDALSMLTGRRRRIVLLGLVMMHFNRRLGAIESTLPPKGARGDAGGCLHEMDYPAARRYGGSRGAYRLRDGCSFSSPSCAGPRLVSSFIRIKRLTLPEAQCFIARSRTETASISRGPTFFSL